MLAFSACNSADPPAARSGNSGNVAFTLRGRSLLLKPVAAATPIRVALFSGGGLAGPPSEEALARLRDTRADVFVVLGGLGRSSAQAAPSLRALASLARLTMLVRDGADSFDFDDQKPGTAGLLLDASALRSVRLGPAGQSGQAHQDELVPWPGSDQGRYSVPGAGRPGCGFGSAELKRAIDELGAKPVGDRRWLITWQTPEPGSGLAELVVRARIDGVLSAWPPLSHPDPKLNAQADSADDSWDPARPKLVPRAWGPTLEGPEGPLAPYGAIVLEFESAGPRVVR